MKSHIVIGGNVDIEIRERAVPDVRIRATFSGVSGRPDGRGATEAEALRALAVEMRRVADSIDARAEEVDRVADPVDDSRNFQCNVCHNKMRGPLGVACPFEHYPEGHAVEVTP